MIRKGLFASALVASALLAAPQAHAMANFGAVSGVVNQLHNNSSFSPNTMSFGINNGGQHQTLFTGVSGLHNFLGNPGNMGLINNWAGTYNPNPSGYSGYKFTYSVLGSFFNSSANRNGAPDPGLTPQNSPAPQNTAPVPEPGTWILMILGLGVVGMTMRRRHNRKAGSFA